MSYQTEQRSCLVELLKRDPHRLFTVKELAEELAPHSVSVSAIYRNLALLTEEGLVRKTNRKGSREAVYRYAAGEACRDEIHMTCVSCGKVFHMDHELARVIQDNLDKADGFRLDKTKTVLYGVCRECSKK